MRSLAVIPRMQRAGPGKALYTQALLEAERNDARALHLLTTTAAGFFEKAEFTIIDRAKVPAAISSCTEFRMLCGMHATPASLTKSGSATESARAPVSRSCPNSRGLAWTRVHSCGLRARRESPSLLQVVELTLICRFTIGQLRIRSALACATVESRASPLGRRATNRSSDFQSDDERRPPAVTSTSRIAGRPAIIGPPVPPRAPDRPAGTRRSCGTGFAR